MEILRPVVDIHPSGRPLGPLVVAFLVEDTADIAVEVVERMDRSP